MHQTVKDQRSLKSTLLSTSKYKKKTEQCFNNKKKLATTHNNDWPDT